MIPSVDDVITKYVEYKYTPDKDTTVNASWDPLSTPSFCKFENNALSVKLRDGTFQPVTFDSKSGNTDMLNVFQILYNHWKSNGPAAITKDDLTKQLLKKGYKQDKLTDRFLKDTIANIRGKIQDAHLEMFVHIDYSKKFQGYTLDILDPNAF